MKTQFPYIALIVLTSFSCKNMPEQQLTQQQLVINTHEEYDSTRNAEARNDSLFMTIALRKNATFTNRVWVSTETEAVEAGIYDDAADDPAIWINTANPEESLVLGTEKSSGVYVYDLYGQTKQFISAGSINNIDVRSGFIYEGRNVSVAAGSNRSINAISIFLIDEETAIVSDTVANFTSGVDEVYGITLYKSAVTNNLFAFVNGKGGKVEQWQIDINNDSISADLKRTFSVRSQPEGMVTNDKTGMLYIGVEEYGIAQFNAEPRSDTSFTWLENSTAQNPAIAFDIEGLAIYHGTDKTYLMASIQGNFSYAIWDITGEEEARYLTSFVIWSKSIDGVEETDGLELTSVALGSTYPKGMLVVQDGFNYDGDTQKAQNFKYISWELIEEFLTEE